MPAVLRRIPAVALLALVVALLPSPGAKAETPPTGALVDQRILDDLATLPGMTPYAAFVHFTGGSAEDRKALLNDHGIDAVRDFDSVDVVYATGALADIAGLRDEAEVSYVEFNRELAYHGETATWASRVRVAQEAVAGGPYRDRSGNILDGTGVGVAVVDSGIDGLHPDLANNIGANYKVVCSTPGLINTTTEQCFGPVAVVDLPTGEATGGHGTHVSGIVAGDGTASKGTFRGVAPKATLFGYSVGEVISVLFAAEAFNHMLVNYNSFSPRLRVINNSYGETSGTAFNSKSVQTLLANQLIAKGVVITWSAGNNGGTGAADATGSQSKNPTPGSISVANYDDANLGSRDNTLVSGSSRGSSSNSDTFPDISAPGRKIMSTCTATLPVCHANTDVTPIVVAAPPWAPHYFSLGGTSMAAPHVAGAAALLLQARPELTPAQVEDVLLDTARKFRFAGDGAYISDPQNPGGTTSFDKGAGLLDLKAALDALAIAHDGPTLDTTPRIDVTAPTEGAVFDGLAPISVSASAYDGVPAPLAAVPTLVAGSDAGDFGGPGAADLVSLSVVEVANGVTYTVTMRNLSDIGPLNPSFRLFQTINAKSYATLLSISSTGATASAYDAAGNNAVATGIVRDLARNTISFTLPFVDPDGTAPDTSIGNPPVGAIAHNVRVVSFIGLAADQLPGGIATASTLQPEFGAAYDVARPSLVARPTATATLSVDGGAPTAAAVTGSSPNYQVTGSVDPTTLADGTHILTTTLLLNGVAKATDTTTFVIERPRVVTSSIAITSPTDGATVARQIVDVTGTAGSDAPDEQVRSVTVQVTGSAYDSGELPAFGVDTWSRSVDFGALDAGVYLVTARLSLDSAVVATDARTIVVPAAPILVSCAPQALSFWQSQYDGGRKAVLTSEESVALAARGAELSEGYFADARSLTTTLFVSKKSSAELLAARQYAVLLLNLAGGELSAGYSRQVGLSGAEQLSSTIYDTSVVGTTVRAAATWVGDQLPGGDLSRASTVASAISRGEGLTC